MAKSPLELSGKINAAQQEIRYPRGTSKEYTDRVNKAYEDAIPLLKEKGYDIDSFSHGGMRQFYDDLFEKHKARENEIRENLKRKNDSLPLDKREPMNFGNELWNLEFRGLFNALNAVSDKLYNDEFIKSAPFGYEE